jgi:hypothetical protein
MDCLAPNAETKNGPASRAHAAESGIKVQSRKDATTECEVDPAKAPDRASGLEPRIETPNAEGRTAIATATLDQKLPM